MKKLYKIITLIICMISISGCSISNAEKTEALEYSTETSVSEDETEAEDETETEDEENKMLCDCSFYDVYEENEIEDMLANKNPDIEMPIKEYTSENELLAEIIRTYVSCSISTDNFAYNFGANIYDIDDKYVYLITCSHGIPNTYFSDCSSGIYSIRKIQLQFFNGDSIAIPKEYIYMPEHPEENSSKDIALIKIPLNEINPETLKLLKSINFRIDWEKVTMEEFKNSDFYIFNTDFHQVADTDFNYIFYKSNTTGEEEHYDFPKFSNKICFRFRNLTSIEEGCSGSAIVSQNGVYNGFVSIRTIDLRFLHEYNQLLKQVKNNENIENTGVNAGVKESSIEVKDIADYTKNEIITTDGERYFYENAGTDIDKLTNLYHKSRENSEKLAERHPNPTFRAIIINGECINLLSEIDCLYMGLDLH